MNESERAPEIIGTGQKWVMKNVMSASVLPPPEGFPSRLHYWIQATGIDSPECAHEICSRPATHGAIALRAFSSDTRRYVFPACETCVRRTEMLFVDGPFVIID